MITYFRRRLLDFHRAVAYFPRALADGAGLRPRRLGLATPPRRARSLPYWGRGRHCRQLQTAPIPLILGPGGSPAGTGSPRGKAPMVQTPWQGVSSEEVTHARR